MLKIQFGNYWQIDGYSGKMNSNEKRKRLKSKTAIFQTMGKKMSLQNNPMQCSHRENSGTRIV